MGSAVNNSPAKQDKGLSIPIPTIPGAGTGAASGNGTRNPNLYQRSLGPNTGGVQTAQTGKLP